MAEVLQRILKRTVETAGGCREWQGYREKKGYGRTSYAGRQVYVHRAVWELQRGEIPEGLTVDHLCRNRACANVEHLELVPSDINIKRGADWRRLHEPKTHCKRGHAFTEENTYWKAGSRQCRACNKGRYQRKIAPWPEGQCRHGHHYTPENTYWSSGGVRFCRACLAASKTRGWERRHPEGTPAACGHCGGSLVGKRRGTRYCSPYCVGAAAYQRRLEKAEQA